MLVYMRIISKDKTGVAEITQVSLHQPKVSDLLEAHCASVSQAWQLSNTL